MTATKRAEWMALRIFIAARANHDVITNDLVDAEMSRDAALECGKANKATVRRIVRKKAASEGFRVIFTEGERYWAIREQLHLMTRDEVHALRDAIADGGDDDPRGWDETLIDAIAARLSDRVPPRRLDRAQAIPAHILWREPRRPAVEERPAPAPESAPVVPVEDVTIPVIDADTYWLDVLDADGAVFTSTTVDRAEAQRIAAHGTGKAISQVGEGVITVMGVATNMGPRTHVLTPQAYAMRTVNGGTPERIDLEAARREVRWAMSAEGRKGVRGLSGVGDEVTIIYADVRGVVELRPATAEEAAMEWKPEAERYAPGDRVIVRGVYYRPETRTHHVLPEYEGMVVNWHAGHYNVRAVEPDEHGAHGVRQCRVRELRPADAVGVMREHAQSPGVVAALEILRAAGVRVATVPGRKVLYREWHSPQGPQGAFIWPGAGRTLEVSWFIDGAQDERGMRSRDTCSVRAARNQALDDVADAFRESGWTVWRVKSSNTATRRALRVDVTPPAAAECQHCQGRSCPQCRWNCTRVCCKPAPEAPAEPAPAPRSLLGDLPERPAASGS